MNNYLSLFVIRHKCRSMLSEDLLLILPLYLNGAVRQLQMTCSSKLYTLNISGYSLQSIGVIISSSNVAVGLK